MPCPGTKLLEVHHIYGEDSDVLARSRWRAPHGLPQAQPARGIGQAEGMRMGGGELRLRVPREPRKERVIAFRLRVGLRCGLAHSADEYTDDQQDEQAER